MSAQSSDTPLFDQLEDSVVEYREVPGFPGYRVGDDGSVWSNKLWGSTLGGQGAWRKLSPAKNPKTGYLAVNLHVNGKGKTHTVHSLVLRAFLGSRPNGMEARHKNAIRTDCRLSNLEWGTHAQNQGDMVKHGHSTRGSKNPLAKLTEEDVRQIKRLIASGVKGAIIAAKFGVDRSCISHIARGFSWRHIL